MKKKYTLFKYNRIFAGTLIAISEYDGSYEQPIINIIQNDKLNSYVIGGKIYVSENHLFKIIKQSNDLEELAMLEIL